MRTMKRKGEREEEGKKCEGLRDTGAKVEPRRRIGMWERRWKKWDRW